MNFKNEWILEDTIETFLMHHPVVGDKPGTQDVRAESFVHS